MAETETRVAATDPAARNAFGRYWMVIRASSGCIRRDWLRAVAHRVATRWSRGWWMTVRMTAVKAVWARRFLGASQPTRRFG